MIMTGMENRNKLNPSLDSNTGTVYILQLPVQYSTVYILQLISHNTSNPV